MKRKQIYSYYKERLVEIGGNSKCLFLRAVARKNSYDVGRILTGRPDRIEAFREWLGGQSSAPFSLLSKEDRKEIPLGLSLNDVTAGKKAKKAAKEAEILPQNDEQTEKGGTRAEKSALIDGEILRLKEIKREVEEIEKDTGRYELYLGYPFVLGAIRQGAAKTQIRAPLLFFPVKLEIRDGEGVTLTLNESEKIQFNRSLIFAVATAERLNVDALELDFDSFSRFKSEKDLLSYLAKAGIRIRESGLSNILPFRFGNEKSNTGLSVFPAAVVGRFPLSGAIYKDYTEMERKRLNNEALTELFRTDTSVKEERRAAKKNAKTAKKAASVRQSYPVKMLDFSQEEVLRRVDRSGNMVVYGPPGTGKSQTIVNLITDAVAKGKRVLVVSQKKAALDVVYNRLGPLSKKAMYLCDEEKEKQSFYSRCLTAHQEDLIDTFIDLESLESQYSRLQEKIDAECEKLNTIYHLLNDVRPFGLSLADMYSASHLLQKNTWEYGIYSAMLETPALMKLDYPRLSDALLTIRAKDLAKTYYDFLLAKEKNPVVDRLKEGLGIEAIEAAKTELQAKIKEKHTFFDTSRYPYYRQVVAYYNGLKNPKTMEALAEFEQSVTGKHRLFPGKERAAIHERLRETAEAIDTYCADYAFLRTVLDEDGYLSVVDNLLRGNYAYLRFVLDGLEHYISLRDVGNLMRSLNRDGVTILDFAYQNGRNYQNYLDIVSIIPECRIYHEILGYEEKCKEEFAYIVDYQNIAERIDTLKKEQLKIASSICDGRNCREYDRIYREGKDAKDYFYQISKKQKFWPIRKTVEAFSHYILCLFPCWLLSPENVSTLLPLTKDLFDLVIFDEASQVFIESTVPAIYRGKCLVVAGDSKQLRPSATFMKRYLGGDPDLEDDYATQAALEVESLLDLAIARFDSANLTYHYRSEQRELIDFSNNAFYEQKLQIAPNISKNGKDSPIERHLVKGKWIDRQNPAEAKEIVDLLKTIFASRKHGETVGIITFNSEQQSCIADAIDREAAKDPAFRAAILAEQHRVENGEDVSLFIKNLENVQGEERDVILFSIGYAKNEQGHIYANFGSLSSEGGENRLNVAITRARKKIIVVSSIEPEDLKVDGTKNLGPKLLAKFLFFVRAVSEHRDGEAALILSDLSGKESTEKPLFSAVPVEEQIKERLEKAGYEVETRLGNKNTRISIAVYDRALDRYLVGVELDRDAFSASPDCMERDVSKPRFLASRGWNLIRVFTRDYWLSPQKTVRRIITAAERERARLTAEK